MVGKMGSWERCDSEAGMPLHWKLLGHSYLSNRYERSWGRWRVWQREDHQEIWTKSGQTTSKHIESSGSEKECLQNVGDSRLINLFVIIIPKLGLWILTAQSGITFLMATWLHLVGNAWTPTATLGLETSWKDKKRWDRFGACWTHDASWDIHYMSKQVASRPTCQPQTPFETPILGLKRSTSLRFSLRGNLGHWWHGGAWADLFQL